MEWLWLLLLFVLLFWMPSSTSVNRAYRQIGNVRVYQPSLDHPWGGWPEAIRVVNTYGNAEGALDEEVKLTPETGAMSAPAMRQREEQSPFKRTFSWRKDELLVQFEIAPPTALGCTKLTPPLTWLATASTGARVKVLHESEGFVDLEVKHARREALSHVQLGIARPTVDSSLALFRMNGFQKDDIFRMLDKGPWVLAFDLSKILPRLLHDLQSDIGATSSEAVHIVSHCPFLLAQYARYRGRDVRSTAVALMEVGYKQENFVEDVMRFPTMLSAPPDRLRGWQGLLHSFGVATEPHTFGKLLQRAPYMFYIDPPSVLDTFSPDFGDSQVKDATTTAGKYFVFEALENLHILRGLRSKDLDRIVRTEPHVLLEKPEELKQRLDFLLGLFRENVEAGRRRQRNGVTSGTGVEYGDRQGLVDGRAFMSGEMGAMVDLGNKAEEAEEQDKTEKAKGMLRSFLAAYPNVLSVQVAHMRAVCNAIRSCGVRRADVVKLVRKFPRVLGLDVEYVKDLIMFLREVCGLRKIDVVPFLLHNTAIFKISMSDLHEKSAYFFEIGGNVQDLRDCPQFLTHSLHWDIMPRCEFFKALHVHPLSNGLSFLTFASSDEISHAAGVETSIYDKFADAYRQKMQAVEYREEDKAVKISISTSAASVNTRKQHRQGQKEDMKLAVGGDGGSQQF